VRCNRCPTEAGGSSSARARPIVEVSRGETKEPDAHGGQGFAGAEGVVAVTGLTNGTKPMRALLCGRTPASRVALRWGQIPERVLCPHTGLVDIVGKSG